MTGKKFTTGDIVYGHGGERAEYVCKTLDLHVVLPIYEDEDGQEYRGDPNNWRECFASPPRAQYDEQIRSLQTDEQRISAQVAELRAERDQLNREMAARKKERERHEQLRHLDDFIAGRITHYVISDWAVDVLKFEDTVCKGDDGRERWPKQMRLLSLFGGSNGNLQWRLSSYSDGSDRNGGQPCIPCCSFDEALGHLKAFIETRFAEWSAKRADPKLTDGQRDSGVDSFVQAAEKYGIPIPDDIAGYLRARARRGAERKVIDARASLQAAEEQLAKAAA